jgi:hypothetical protein
MNAELEALILALDAVIEATAGEEAQRLEAIYQSRIDDLLTRHPRLSRERVFMRWTSHIDSGYAVTENLQYCLHKHRRCLIRTAKSQSDRGSRL